MSAEQPMMDTIPDTQLEGRPERAAESTNLTEFAERVLEAYTKGPDAFAAETRKIIDKLHEDVVETFPTSVELRRLALNESPYYQILATFTPGETKTIPETLPEAAQIQAFRNKVREAATSYIAEKLAA